MMRWLRTVPTFLIGAGVGAALGVFFAPRSGEKTRRLIKEKAQDSVNDVVSRGRKAAQRAQRAVDDAREVVSGAVNDARKAGKGAFQDAARNS
jgi:gas vesicle protein